MKLWMSAEIDKQATPHFIEARKKVMLAVNHELQSGPIDEKPKQWAVIVILREVPSSDYPEVSRYHKKDDSLEFRLAVNFGEFLRTDDVGRCRLLLAMLGRSVTLMPKLGVSQERCAELESALSRVAERVVSL